MANNPIVDHYSCLESDLQKVFNEIVAKYDLHKNTFTYERSHSQKSGKVTSCGIFINEMTYPPVKSDTVLSSNLIGRIKARKNGQLEILIRNDQFANIIPPESAIIKDVKDKTYQHIVFDAEDKSLIDYLYKNILYCLENYKPSSVFGCCSRYKACSDAKKCLHSNFLYAKGCQYRQNLEAGRIFY